MQPLFMGILTILLLQQHNITALADVRSFPYSRRFPHFQRLVLQKQL
jgi:hypothetical protein